MKKGQKLYKKAKQIIPGGTMLLSKRPEMFLPENWPAYFSKSKGCKVWTLDNEELIDMSIMGIGTNSLGYGNEEVDLTVQEIIKKGNMSTLNCPEEVHLAEELIKINPWADMVRFARTGGEANAISIRIARAASGKDGVAICGYHGWHDWYLSVNHNNGKDNLSKHLLPGLQPLGVPKNLKGSVHPFEYNNFQELEDIVNNNDIGVIKMEVVRNFGPENNFLNKVRDLATKNNIVLIFDECTSGFRETYGGIFKKYNVNPDMVMFGKTMGNGYAITAVVGNRAVMESAQNTFISSTFWTERIGPTAALKTLEIDDLRFSTNVISTTVSNADIDIVPSGSGKVDVQGNLAVTGNLDITGNLTADGDITISGNVQIGDEATDTISIANHGYGSGEIVKYTADVTAAGGLTSGTEYYLTKVNNFSSFNIETVSFGIPIHLLTYFWNGSLGYSNIATSPFSIVLKAGSLV